MSPDSVVEPPPPEIGGLTAAPPLLGPTREALHRLAEQVLSPVQADVNGDIHFRWTPGGFGTPRFGIDSQLRVDGATLVLSGGGECRRRPIGSLRDAAAFVGRRTAGIDETPLEIDDAAARWLGDLFGFAYAVLSELIADVPGGAPIRLWPEHFDIATDLARAAYGVSPGDEHHPEPYLYVAPWDPVEGELWQAAGFTGAELAVSELRSAGDQRAAALEFFRRRRAALTERTSTHA
jgi:hypothetical protein